MSTEQDWESAEDAYGGMISGLDTPFPHRVDIRKPAYRPDKRGVLYPLPELVVVALGSLFITAVIAAIWYLANTLHI